MAQSQRVLVRIVLLCILGVARGQLECMELQLSDLGSTDAPTSTGLLYNALQTILGEGGGFPIQILESRTVCLGQGARRGLYRSTSVVVRYSGPTEGSVLIAQVDYQCEGGMWTSPIFPNSPPEALNTTLRTDCNLCSGLTVVPSTEAEHCVGMYMHVRISCNFNLTN
jgi:hypothetical protein